MRSPHSRFGSVLVTLFAMLLLVTGCAICPTSGVCGPRCADVHCFPHGTPHHSPAHHCGRTDCHFHPHPTIRIITQPKEQTEAVEIIPEQSLNLQRSFAMPLTVDPIHAVPKAMREICELIAATDQFQTETGSNAADSLDQFCRWPAVRGVTGFLKAPLCLHTMEPELLIGKTKRTFHNGETYLQLALITDSELTDERDRWADFANRAYTVLDQALALAHNDSDRWQFQGWEQIVPTVENDLHKYRFQDKDGVEAQVEVLATVVQWFG